MTSLGVKSRVGSLICSMAEANVMYVPEIHLWCDTCQLLVSGYSRIKLKHVWSTFSLEISMEMYFTPLSLSLSLSLSLTHTHTHTHIFHIVLLCGRIQQKLLILQFKLLRGVYCSYKRLPDLTMLTAV